MKIKNIEPVTIGHLEFGEVLPDFAVLGGELLSLLAGELYSSIESEEAVEMSLESADLLDCGGDLLFSCCESEGSEKSKNFHIC